MTLPTVSPYPPTLVTPPNEAPVTAAEVRTQCPGSSASDDAMLAGMIDAAVGQLDGWHGSLGRCLVTQQWAQTFDRFCSRMALPFPDVSNVIITYLDGEGAEQVLDDTYYAIREGYTGAYIELAYGQSWPSTYGEKQAVTVTFDAGFGGAADVPPAIRQAIVLMSSRLFRSATRDATLIMDRTDGVGTYQWDNSGALAAAYDQTIVAMTSQYRRARL